jgi:hypothetical protein
MTQSEAVKATDLNTLAIFQGNIYLFQHRVYSQFNVSRLKFWQLVT